MQPSGTRIIDEMHVDFEAFDRSAATDLLITGGGLVGASLAIALDMAGRDAVLVEAAAPVAESQPSYDERNLALSRATVNGLRWLGVWAHAEAAATPIREIHVSRAGDYGSTRLRADRLGLDALGWTLPARELGRALLARLATCRHLRRLTPARVTGIVPAAVGWQARIEATDGQSRALHAKLVVGADGSQSQLRALLGIETERHDYRQYLFVCTVSPERAHQGRAWERFTDAGPVALLPLTEGRCGLVLTVPAVEAEAVAALDDQDFIELAQQRFGWWLGRLRRPGRRHHYPIASWQAQRLYAERAVLVGNAAQTVHPIGAQGFNLGLRDALTLAEELAGHADPGTAALLTRYAERRRRDRRRVIAASHGLIEWACHSPAWLGPLRSLGLLAFDQLPPLRQALARQAMGLRLDAPRTVLEPLG